MAKTWARYGGAFKVTDGLMDEFGSGRVIDTPISEAAIVGAACGAGLMGMKAVAEFQFIDFISAGFDLLTNYAAKSRYRWGANIPAVFRGPCGSGVRSGPFHSLNAGVVFPEYRRAEDSRACDCLRRERIDQSGDSRS